MYQAAAEALRASPKKWLVTGAAGFIGSHLCERLRRLGQKVVGVDNFSTGLPANIEFLRSLDGGTFEFIEGDIAETSLCRQAVAGADIVLHQAALGSVPRSIADPQASHRANVDGFVNILLAAKDAGVRRFVYASSSSVYGDSPASPKREEDLGNLLSPYAATKRIDELYAAVYGRAYGTETIGLRYFNVFGARQNPEGPYAAVIPKWLGQLTSGGSCTVYGDGETSRDFCYVENVVQANLLAGTTTRSDAISQVFNIAVGATTSLNRLYSLIVHALGEQTGRSDFPSRPVYAEFRAGDIRHSFADVSKAKALLGYQPSFTVEQGIRETVRYYTASR